MGKSTISMGYFSWVNQQNPPHIFSLRHGMSTGAFRASSLGDDGSAKIRDVFQHCLVGGSKDQIEQLESLWYHVLVGGWNNHLEMWFHNPLVMTFTLCYFSAMALVEIVDLAIDSMVDLSIM